MDECLDTAHCNGSLPLDPAATQLPTYGLGSQGWAAGLPQFIDHDQVGWAQYRSVGGLIAGCPIPQTAFSWAHSSITTPCRGGAELGLGPGPWVVGGSQRGRA